MAGATSSFVMGFVTCLVMASFFNQMGQIAEVKETQSIFQPELVTQQVVNASRKIKTFDWPEGFVLPKTIYLVTGLESVGSNLISDILAEVFQVKYHHTEFSKHPNSKGKNKDIWVQHISLPSVRPLSMTLHCNIALHSIPFSCHSIPFEISTSRALS